jgi:hypothetical protein
MTPEPSQDHDYLARGTKERREIDKQLDGAMPVIVSQPVLAAGSVKPTRSGWPV